MINKNDNSKKIIGYTCGVFDMFHIGHLNLLKNAKKKCDYLIVGVTKDELVKYKNKKTVINENDRKEIVGSIKYVDEVIWQEDIDKYKAWEKLNFNCLFVGDDWKGNENWKKWEQKLKEKNVEVIYFPYTKSISSTLLKKKLNIDP